MESPHGRTSRGRTSSNRRNDGQPAGRHDARRYHLTAAVSIMGDYCALPTLDEFIALAILLATIGTAQAFDESKYPDGRSVAPIRTWSPRYDPSKPVGRGQQAPLTAEEYKAVHAASSGPRRWRARQ
jgi:hypothetical protein